MAAIALADTADFDTLFEIDDDAGPRLVRRRFRGAEAAEMRALIEADDVALIDDADTAPLAPPADWIASRDAALARLGLTLDDLPF
jgi:hypothetical protein